MKQKIEIISNKLIKFGFIKSELNKSSVSIDYTSNQLLDDMSKMIFNDYIPDLGFSLDGTSVEVYLDKELVKLNLDMPSKDIGSLSVQEVIPVRYMTIDEFYMLITSKSFGLDKLFITGSN